MISNAESSTSVATLASSTDKEEFVKQLRGSRPPHHKVNHHDFGILNWKQYALAGKHNSKFKTRQMAEALSLVQQQLESIQTWADAVEVACTEMEAEVKAARAAQLIAEARLATVEELLRKKGEEPPSHAYSPRRGSPSPMRHRSPSPSVAAGLSQTKPNRLAIDLDLGESDTPPRRSATTGASTIAASVAASAEGTGASAFSTPQHQEQSAANGKSSSGGTASSEKSKNRSSFFGFLSSKNKKQTASPPVGGSGSLESKIEEAMALSSGDKK